MSKEFDEFIADKPELNIATKEEVSLVCLFCSLSDGADSAYMDLHQCNGERKAKR